MSEDEIKGIVEGSNERVLEDPKGEAIKGLKQGENPETLAERLPLSLAQIHGLKGALTKKGELSPLEEGVGYKTDIAKESPYKTGSDELEAILKSFPGIPDSVAGEVLSWCPLYRGGQIPAPKLMQILESMKGINKNQAAIITEKYCLKTAQQPFNPLLSMTSLTQPRVYSEEQVRELRRLDSLEHSFKTLLEKLGNPRDGGEVQELRKEIREMRQQQVTDLRQELRSLRTEFRNVMASNDRVLGVVREGRIALQELSKTPAPQKEKFVEPQAGEGLASRLKGEWMVES